MLDRVTEQRSTAERLRQEIRLDGVVKLLFRDLREPAAKRDRELAAELLHQIDRERAARVELAASGERDFVLRALVGDLRELPRPLEKVRGHPPQIRRYVAEWRVLVAEGEPRLFLPRLDGGHRLREERRTRKRSERRRREPALCNRIPDVNAERA